MTTEDAFFIPFYVAFVALSYAPALIALWRKHDRRWWIITANVGASFIRAGMWSASPLAALAFYAGAWIALMVWAQQRKPVEA